MALVGAQIGRVEGSHDALAARAEVESIDYGTIGAHDFPIHLPHGAALLAS